MKVILDHRSGVNNTNFITKASEVSEAIKLVSKLDGNRHTVILFEKLNGSQLIIGGGKNNFVITLTQNEQHLTLKSDVEANNQLIEICAGGQYGDYPNFLVQSIEQVNKTVEAFFADNECNLNWV